MSIPTQGLWDFSVERYGRPGVAEICLRLQDQAGADVNIVLACLWCAQRGAAMNAADVAALAEGDAGGWHDAVVRPLRAARRAMKHPPAALPAGPVEALRTRLKKIELEAERQEQSVLETLLLALPADPAAPDTHRLARANLDLYMARLGSDPAALGELLDTLVHACVDEGRVEKGTRA